MLSVTDAFFIVFAVLTLLPALLVVLQRNPVNSAMFMIVSFVGLAGLFVLLEAFFLAALQVVVYAGAVMVLFLFIIMLIEVESPRRVKPGIVSLAASAVAFLLLAGGAAFLFQSELRELIEVPEAPGQAALSSEEGGPTQAVVYSRSVSSYGVGLFTKYMLPFQVTGFLLLVAMIGVIVISKKYDPEARPRRKRSALIGG